MRIFVYPTHELIFERPFFVECNTVQNLFSSEIKSCDNIEDADLAFFPLQLGSGLVQQIAGNCTLPLFPNIQWEWKRKWSPIIKKNLSKKKHFVLLSYVLYNVNLSFIEPEITILAFEREVTLNIVGTLANFGCYNRMMTIPYFVDTSMLTNIKPQKTINILFIGSLLHAKKYRIPLIDLLNPEILNVSHGMDYLSIYSSAILSFCGRGDTPTRACFYQSIFAGCCPIIYRNCYIHYKNLYGGTLPIEDLCLIIPDFDFDKSTNTPLSKSYQNEVLTIVQNYLLDTNKKQTRFNEQSKIYKSHLNYQKKIDGMSAPIYHALTSLILQKKKLSSLVKDKLVFIVNLEPSYNTGIFPVRISETNLIIMGNKTSQYELEIHWHQVIQNSFSRTVCIELADFVFIPFYTFLFGWKDGKFQNVEIAKKIKQLIIDIPSWIQKPNLPHILVYAGNCVDITDAIKWPSNTVLVSLESASQVKNNFRMLTSPYLNYQNEFKMNESKFNNDSKRNYVLSYIGTKSCPLFHLEFKEHPNCRLIFIELSECENNSKEVQDLYANSIFSLILPADNNLTHKSFFQSITEGCIPIIFQNSKQAYQQHTTISIDELCVIIPLNTNDKFSIDFVLGHISTISKKEISDKRTCIRHNLLNYIFSDFNSIPVFNIIKQIF